MESPTPTLTLDDFFEKIIKPQAESGKAPYMVMMEAWEAAKRGEMTPDLAREFAKKVIP